MFIPILQYRNKFEVYSTMNEDKFSHHLYDTLREDLIDAYMNNRWRHNCEYVFSGSSFRFIWNGFNKFNGVKKCSLKINKNLGLVTMYAKYEFTEVFFLCLVFSIIPMMDFWGSGAYRLIVFLLIWAVYFANFGISIARLNTYFKRLMKDTFIDYDKSYKKKLL